LWKRTTFTSSIFSFYFPTGEAERLGLAFSLHDRDPDSSCELFRTDARGSDFVYVGVSLNRTSMGAYEVLAGPLRAEELGEGASLFAAAKVTRVLDGRRMESVRPIGGVIEVQSAPRTIAEWNAEATAAIRGELRMPLQYSSMVRCEGGRSVDGTSSYSECQCIDQAGNSFVCVPNAPEKDCCSEANLGSDWELFTFEALARPCAELCYEPSGPYRFCEELKEGL
jgi:hypothetical protein